MHSRPLRRALVLAVLGLLLLGGGSLASWLITRANPGNVFTAGVVRLGDSVSGPILGGHDLSPGQAVSGTVTITNGATIPVTLTLGATAVSPPPHAPPDLGGVLQLSVADCTAAAACTSVYTGTLAGLAASTVALPGNLPSGRWAPGEAHLFQFTAALPLTTSADLMGGSAAADFVWSAANG